MKAVAVGPRFVLMLMPRMGPSTYLSIKTWRERRRMQGRRSGGSAGAVMIRRAVEDQMDHRLRKPLYERVEVEYEKLTISKIGYFSQANRRTTSSVQS